MEPNRPSRPPSAQRFFNPGEGSRSLLDSVVQANREMSSDNHSSEEELEVINAGARDPLICPSGSRCRALTVNLRSSNSSLYPEKRSWSQRHPSRTRPTRASRSRLVPEIRSEQSSGSSDEEIQGLLANMDAPVEFRTSPPSDLVRPGRSSDSPTSPPHKIYYQDGTLTQSRRSNVNGRTNTGRNPCSSASGSGANGNADPPRHLLERPFLDFEKMQQLKARAVTAWRHNGDQGGELSVYCW